MNDSLQEEAAIEKQLITKGVENTKQVTGNIVTCHYVSKRSDGSQLDTYNIQVPYYFTFGIEKTTEGFQKVISVKVIGPDPSNEDGTLVVYTKLITQLVKRSSTRIVQKITEHDSTTNVDGKSIKEEQNKQTGEEQSPLRAQKDKKKVEEGERLVKSNEEPSDRDIGSDGNDTPTKDNSQEETNDDDAKNQGGY